MTHFNRLLFSAALLCLVQASNARGFGPPPPGPIVFPDGQEVVVEKAGPFSATLTPLTIAGRDAGVWAVLADPSRNRVAICHRAALTWVESDGTTRTVELPPPPSASKAVTFSRVIYVPAMGGAIVVRMQDLGEAQDGIAADWISAEDGQLKRRTIIHEPLLARNVVPATAGRFVIVGVTHAGDLAAWSDDGEQKWVRRGGDFPYVLVGLLRNATSGQYGVVVAQAGTTNPVFYVLGADATVLAQTPLPQHARIANQRDWNDQLRGEIADKLTCKYALGNQQFVMNATLEETPRFEPPERSSVSTRGVSVSMESGEIVRLDAFAVISMMVTGVPTPPSTPQFQLRIESDDRKEQTLFRVRLPANQPSAEPFVAALSGWKFGVVCAGSSAYRVSIVRRTEPRK